MTLCCNWYPNQYVWGCEHYFLLFICRTSRILTKLYPFLLKTFLQISSLAKEMRLTLLTSLKLREFEDSANKVSDSMNGWIDGWVDGCVDGLVGWVNEWMGGGGWIDGLLGVWVVGWIVFFNTCIDIRWLDHGRLNSNIASTILAELCS